MSDTTNKDEDTATKAKGRKEKELNEQAAGHKAEEKQAEQEAEAIEQPDQPEEPTDPDQLRGEIADAREDLGNTVEALAAKTDVKAQAKQKVDEKKARAQSTIDEQKARAQTKLDEATKQVKEKPAPAAGVAGVVVALLLLILFLKRRR